MFYNDGDVKRGGAACPQDLAAAWQYVAGHRDEIDSAIAANRTA